MKILLVQTFHYRRGGDCTYTFALADLLRAHGHEVAFFAMRHPRNLPCAQERYFVNSIDFRELAQHVNPWNGARVLSRSIYSVSARRNLTRLLRDERPDVAHLQNIHAHLTPSVLHALRAGHVPAVWTLHDFKLICPDSRLLSNGVVCEACKGGRFFSCVERRCKKGSLAASAVAALEATAHRFLDLPSLVHRFIAPSRFLLEKFREFGWPEERFVHVPNFLPDPAPAEGRSGGDEGYALYLGQIEAWKGIPTLLEACALRPDLRVVLAGEGSARASGERFVAERGLRGVTFAGQLEGSRLAEVVRGASVVVAPSACYENCPYSVLEAMAAGKPVIASSLGGLPELVEDEVNGLLVPPSDSPALARALDRLVADRGLRTRLGERARSIAAERFSAQRHYAAIHAVYEHALAGAARPADLRRERSWGATG